MNPDARTKDQPLIKTYVWHGDKSYFVSTINRDSSAMICQARYAETIVWEWDWDKVERGNIVHQGEGPESSISTHLSICKTLFERGIEGFKNED